MREKIVPCKSWLKRPETRACAFLFVLVLSVCLLTSSGRVRSDGYFSYVAATELLAGRPPTVRSLPYGETRAPIGALGEQYAQYGPGWTATMIPVMLAANIVRARLYVPPESRFLQMAVSSTNSIISALACVALYLLARELGYRRRTGVVLSLSLAFGTLMWSYSREMFSEPACTLAIIAAALFGQRYRRTGGARLLPLCGASVAYAISLKVYWLLLVPFVAGWLVHACLRDRKGKAKVAAELAIFLIPVAIGLVGLAVFSRLSFGSFVALGYLRGRFSMGALLSSLYSLPPYVGVLGLLVSPGKSVFLYCPPLIVAIFGIRRFWRREPVLAGWMVGLVLFYVLFFGSREHWDGGHSWGPRYLLPLVPLMLLPLAELIDGERVAAFTKWSTGTSLVAGVLVQVPNLFIYFGTYMKALIRYDELALGDLYFVPNLSPIIGGWRLLFGGFHNALTGEPQFLYPVKLVRDAPDNLTPVYIRDFGSLWDSWINILSTSGITAGLPGKILVTCCVTASVILALWAARGLVRLLRDECEASVGTCEGQ
jgi:hypothetical protein